MTSKNVLLITIDSLRADYLPDRDAAPALTELGDEGTRFTQAVSNGPNTVSSFPSILTGTHSLMYGGRDYMSDDRPFLAASLRDAGYTTVGYHSNPHLGLERGYNTGFEVFNDGMEKTSDKEESNGTKIPITRDRIFKLIHRRLDNDSFLYKFLRRSWHIFSSTTGSTKYTPARKLTDNALDWLEGCNDSFFMWLHYMDVHYPFHPPDRYLEELGYEPPSARRVANLNGAMHENPERLSESDKEELLNLYRAELRYVDHQLTRVLEALEDMGIRDETLVIATSDHGEAFGEHDRWGHHAYMYDELLRVPLVVHDPDRDSGTIDRQVSLIDIFPTICESCGVSPPENLQGQNLYEPTEEPIAFGAAGIKRLACRTPEWKCLWHTREDNFELYDLQEDPGETDDVSEAHPGVVDRLREYMNDLREEAASTDDELPDVDESEEAKERLRALGYVD